MAEKIRLVDNEATILLSRAFLIKRADHKFFTASDGKITLEKKSPFLSYLDAPSINGPKLTGYQRQLLSLALESRPIRAPNEVNGCLPLTVFFKGE